MINEFITLFKMNLCIDQNFFGLNYELKKEKKKDKRRRYANISNINQLLTLINNFCKKKCLINEWQENYN